jgi:hypothetical protein
VQAKRARASGEEIAVVFCGFLARIFSYSRFPRRNRLDSDAAVTLAVLAMLSALIIPAIIIIRPTGAEILA